VTLHTRRRLLATIGAASSAALAGCSTERFGGGWPRTTETTTDPIPGEERGWAQFGRTPGHAGFAPEVRVDDPDPVWSVNFEGGLTSPAVVEDRVFVHAGPAPESGEAGTVLALDGGGEERWRRTLPGGGGGSSGCPRSSTAALCTSAAQMGCTRSTPATGVRGGVGKLPDR